MCLTLFASRLILSSFLHRAFLFQLFSFFRSFGLWFVQEQELGKNYKLFLLCVLFWLGTSIAEIIFMGFRNIFSSYIHKCVNAQTYSIIFEILKTAVGEFNSINIVNNNNNRNEWCKKDKNKSKFIDIQRYTSAYCWN